MSALNAFKSVVDLLRIMCCIFKHWLAKSMIQHGNIHFIINTSPHKGSSC